MIYQGLVHQQLTNVVAANVVVGSLKSFEKTTQNPMINQHLLIHVDVPCDPVPTSHHQ